MQPTARCARSVLEGCGGVAAERHEQLLEVVGGLLTNSQKKKEDVGEKGFQRTPAFLLAVIKRALSDPGSKEPIHARGLHRRGAAHWQRAQRHLLASDQRHHQGGGCVSRRYIHMLLMLASPAAHCTRQIVSWQHKTGWPADTSLVEANTSVSLCCDIGVPVVENRG